MADVPAILFEQVYGRAATTADRDRLVRVKAGLGLSDQDELWPVLMALDHYSATTTAARADILNALADMPGTFDASMRAMEASAGRRAEAALAQAVTDGAEKLSRLVVARTLRAAEEITARQKIVAGLVGALLGLGFIALGGSGTYFYLERRVGICAEPPGLARNGRSACYVAERVP
ncbi:MAG: hypothetical protein Q27BPR15_15945 [Rhodobacter sp. CACIA14H1]|nr:MAG: hypothetical protein Q27BPR15_15945 [Rhodobacter sp. CACIA14H1]